MPMEDQVIVKFLADTSGLRNAINSVAGMASNVGGGQQARSAASGVAGLNRQASQLSRVSSQVNQRLESSAGLMKELQIQTGGVSSSFRQASSSIQTTIPWLDKFAIQTDRASMVMWKFSMGAIGLRDLAITTGTVAAGMIVATKAMASSVSLVDRVKRQFASIYQSAEIGGKIVDQLVQDAVKIRYSVNEVLDAGRLLSLEGFDPRKLIYDMADLAAGVNQEGITIVNATRAFVDATNGQFRRLKETFQITREDAMQFAPDAFAGPNGQITNQARATEAIIRAVRAKYRGQNEATMQTIQGQASNLGDAMVRALAKTDKAIKPILVGWIGYGIQFFDKLSKFADTGLGKVTAQTIVWGAALMSAASALALLGGGMMTMMGLYSAYNVFIKSRGAAMNDIIEAEMKLMAMSRELAAIDSQRMMTDIPYMEAKLELARALRSEEEARISLLKAEMAGEPTAGLVANVGTASDRSKVAQASVQALQIPRDIAAVEKAIEQSLARQLPLQATLNNTDAQSLLEKQDRLRAVEAEIAANEVLERQYWQNMQTLGFASQEQTAAAITRVRLDAIRANIVSEIAALEGVVTQEQLDQIRAARSELAIEETITAELRQQSAVMREQLALAEGIAGTQAAGGAAQAATGFRGGFGRGFGAVFGGIGNLFSGIVSPLRSAFAGLVNAISGAGGVTTVVGLVTGGLAAVSVAAGVLIGAWKLFVDPAQKAQRELDNAATAAETFADRVNRAAGMLPMSPAGAAGAEETKKFLEGLSKYGKEVANWQITGEAIRPMDFARNKLGMDDEAAANFARRFWELWDADMRKTVPDYGKSNVGKTISQTVQSAGGWKNVTPEQMKQIEKAMTGGTFGMAAGTGSPAEWRNRLFRMGASVNAEQQGMPSTQMMRQQSEAVNAQVEKIRALATSGNAASLKSQYGFGSLEAAQEFLKTFDESTDKVGIFNEEIQNSYKTYKEMGGDVKSVNDFLDEQNDTLLSDAQINDELAKQANTARIAYEGMLATSQALYDVDVKGRVEREKDLAVAKQRMEAAKAQRDYAVQIRNLAANQNAEGLLSASGMGNTGAIFGQDIAAGEWASALAETDPKKRREMIQNAFKTARGGREDETKQALDFYAPGPTASVKERADYERYRARKERERMSGVVSDYNLAIQQGNLTPEQRTRAQRQIATEQRVSNRNIAEYEKNARTIETEDQLKRMQAGRDYAAVRGASPQQLAALDAQILQTKMAEAVANKDIAEQMALQVQYAQLQKATQDELLGAEEAKLSFMETQASQGLISQEAVDAEKQRMAQLYQERAKQAAYGSAEYYQYMQKALQMLGGETENQWDTIIGKIIGAPQSMLQGVLSEGWIARQFGDAANRFGLSNGIQADIVSQRKSEMTIRLTWDGINAIDAKLNTAVQNGMTGFVRDFQAALSGA